MQYRPERGHERERNQRGHGECDGQERDAGEGGHQAPAAKRVRDAGANADVRK